MTGLSKNTVATIFARRCYRDALHVIERDTCGFGAYVPWMDP